jgi:hypothetical protein
MGLGLFPSFKPPLPSVQFDVDGKTLLSELEQLDALATELGVSPLSSFADNREVPHDFSGHPDELDDLLGPWDTWYPPSSAIAPLAQLISSIESSPTVASRFQDPAYLVEELQELLRCLFEAERAKVEFRLAAA